MEDNITWFWRLGVVLLVGILAWLMRNAFNTLTQKVTRVEEDFATHTVEDRVRFDSILTSLGELKGKMDILIGRRDASD